MQKTIFFDLDGTLTTDSTWSLINESLRITQREDHQLFLDYIDQKIDYMTWIAELVKLYKRGPLVSKATLQTIIEKIPLRPEASEVITNAKQKGYTIGIVSGGLDIVVEAVAEKLGISVWFAANTAVFDRENMLIDIAAVPNGERDAKLRYLETYCKENNLDIHDVICVEDGGNGLELFKHAKGILLGNNEELKPLAWKQAQNLSEVIELL